MEVTAAFASGELDRSSAHMLGLLTLAGLSQTTDSPVTKLIRRLSNFFRDVHNTSNHLGTEDSDLQYRIGHLQRHRGSEWSVYRLHQAQRDYQEGQRWIDAWFGTLPIYSVEELQTYRPPVLQPSETFLTARLPVALHSLLPELHRLCGATDDFSIQAVMLLADIIFAAAVPWAPHLLVYILYSAKRDELTENTLLHCRVLHSWLLECYPGSVIQFDGTLDLSKGNSQGRIGGVIRSVTRLLASHYFDLRPDDPARQFIFQPPEGISERGREGWLPLQGISEPQLHQLCETALPTTSPDFFKLKYAIKYLYDHRGLPFYNHLVLMAMAMAKDEKYKSPHYIWKCLMCLGNELPDMAERLDIRDQDFKAKHLEDYLSRPAEELGLTEQLIRHTETQYRSGSQSVARFLEFHPELSLPTRFILPTLTRRIRHSTSEADYKKDMDAATRRRVDIVIDNWSEVHLLAEFRYLLFRKLMLAYRKALASDLSNFPRSLSVSSTDGLQTLSFRIWNVKTFLAQHPQCGSAQWRLAMANNTQTFLEYLPISEETNVSKNLFWCAKTLIERSLGLSRATIHTSGKAKEYLFSKHGLSRLFRLACREGKHPSDNPPCLFEPDEIYGDVLMAHLFLRLVRTTGLRIHEALQVRTEPEFYYKSGLEYRLKVQRKGRKRSISENNHHPDLTLARGALQVLWALIDLQRRNGADFKVVSQRDYAVRDMDPGEYVFNNGRFALRQAVLTNKLRFLLSDWWKVLGEQRWTRVNAHEYRFGFSNAAFISGREGWLISAVLDHSSMLMTNHYTRLSKRQTDQGNFAVRNAILTGEEGRIEDMHRTEKTTHDMQKSSSRLKMKDIEEVEAMLIAHERELDRRPYVLF